MMYSTLISCGDLARHLNETNWVIFDCRFVLQEPATGHSLYRSGHIPSARYADLDQDLSGPVLSFTGRHPLPDFKSLAAKLGGWGVNNQTQVVVYDDAGGAFAARLWWLLRVLGHESVAVLDGGIHAWRQAGLPLTTVLPKVKSQIFRPYLQTGQWLTASEVENRLACKQVCLLDARAKERFWGLVEPIDSVAGHIPGAINRPLQSNLSTTGHFLNPNELRQQFLELCQSFLPEQVVHMCGSGVTACHNLLAVEHAGLCGSRLYAGSWSEWIKNSNRATVSGCFD